MKLNFGIKSDALICFILLFISEFFFKYCLGIEITLYAALLSLIISAFLVSFANMFADKGRIIIESILIVLWNLYLFSQHYYFFFFKNFWSIFNLVQLKELAGVSDEIFVKFNPVLLVYIFIILSWFLLIKHLKVEKTTSKDFSILFPIVFGTIVVFLSVFTVKAFSSFTGKLEIQSERDYLYQTMIDKVSFVEEFGVAEYIRRDVAKAIEKPNKNITNEEIKQIEDWLTTNENNAYTGILKNKNLILVQAESLSDIAINETLTPTLYKLATEGIYFSNVYAPLYPANTNDTEFILQTGLMPSIEGATTSYKCENNYFPYSLANLFKNNGYHANSYHSYFGEFYNRIVMHKTLGFENFYSVKDILPEYIEELSEKSGYWIPDIKLIRSFNENKEEDPSFSFIISASGHMPYYDGREQLAENYSIVKSYFGDKYNDEFAYYIASQMMLDESLKCLIEQNPDSIIVIVGDHYPYGLSEETQNMLLDESDELLKVPFIIYGSEIEPNNITTLRSTFDVYPTLINLFGLEAPVSFGVDAFSDKESTIYLKNGNVITDNYNGPSEDVTPWEIGRLILETDYFRQLTNK